MGGMALHCGCRPCNYVNGNYTSISFSVHIFSLRVSPVHIYSSCSCCLLKLCSKSTCMNPHTCLWQWWVHGGIQHVFFCHKPWHQKSLGRQRQLWYLDVAEVHLPLQTSTHSLSSIHSLLSTHLLPSSSESLHLSISIAIAVLMISFVFSQHRTLEDLIIPYTKHLD